jgi:hypothetical protein
MTTAKRHFAPQRSRQRSPHNPLILSRQDWDMSESNLENALARVADDLSSAADAIREEVAHHPDLLAPGSGFPDNTAGHTEQSDRPGGRRITRRFAPKSCHS